LLSEIIEIQTYDRKFIRANYPDIFVFGDNMERKGYGGQAAEARDCVNSIGIPTKWYPSADPRAFFSDEDFNFVAPVILGEFYKLQTYRKNGYNIWWPKDGIGTGRARLQVKAPAIYALISSEYERLKNEFPYQGS
jgi:hypothetical protein